jgi:hypothetical protein
MIGYLKMAATFELAIIIVLQLATTYTLFSALSQYSTRSFIKKCLPMQCSHNTTPMIFDVCQFHYNVTAVPINRSVIITDTVEFCYSHEQAQRIEIFKTISNADSYGQYNQNCMVDIIDNVGFLGDAKHSKELSRSFYVSMLLNLFVAVCSIAFMGILCLKN